MTRPAERFTVRLAPELVDVVPARRGSTARGSLVLVLVAVLAGVALGGLVPMSTLPFGGGAANRIAEAPSPAMPVEPAAGPAREAAR
jgi:hypothetical protein